MADVRSAGDATANLQPPPAVLYIIKRLEKAGHEAWCVGGAVRDALMGHANLDWDIATSAAPPQVQRTFPRTIPVGIEFGTVGVLDMDGVLHEVTTFRRDVRTDGRHAEVEFGASLDDDLARRDFTVNAIAFSPSSGELRDPFHGRRDIGGRLLRAVGDARARMREDRLRSLRGIRFASRFAFAIEQATWDAIVESAPYLGRLSAERVKQEIEKTLDQVDMPSKAFALWRDSGAFATLVPALEGVSDVQLSAIDRLPRAGKLTRPARGFHRLVALFASMPAVDARETLRALRFSNDESQKAWKVIEAWHAVIRPIGETLARGDVPTDGQIRRWVSAVGRLQWSGAVRVASAIWSSERDAGSAAPTAMQVHSLYRRGVRIAFRDPVAIGDLAVDGDDLRGVGIAPGPQLGRLLVALLDRVLDDPSLNQRDVLLALAKRELV